MARARVADDYRNFAEHEAPGRSPLYVELAAGVANDRETLNWLEDLPTGKRQPNLLFAASRALAGTPTGWPEFRTVLGERRGEIEALMLERRTQTNEAARCALMLPLLAALPQPLALLEVGASAGLCLLPDRYGYDYAGHRIGDGPPILRCEPRNDPPLPRALPEIAWRAGLDLDPIDLTDPEQVRWLELLIWPGQEHRVETLREAIDVARRDPPRVIEGDLTKDLEALAAEAPPDTTLVVFHTAVLYYVPPPGRKLFRAAVDRLGATWLACEGPPVLGFEPVPGDLMALARDGERVAWADGHGSLLSWG
jgi:hypothetical protein